MLDLVRHIDRRRFNPVVLCNAPIVAEGAREAGAAAYVIDGWHDVGERLLPSSGKVRAVREVLDAHDVALVHCNNISPLKAAIPGTRARRIPLLAHLHIISPLNDRLYSGLHQATLAVGVSEAAIGGLRDDGMPLDRIRVVYNGVDPARLETGDAKALRNQLGIAPGHTALVALGSLIPRKGVDVLVDTMALLCDRRDVHLIVVGEGNARAALERQVARRGLEGVVHFLGERRDVGAILRDCGDLALSAARQEAFPLNLLEAAYCGLPVIASDIAPHRESVIDGETGVLVRPDSPEDFALAIRSLLSAPERASALGARGAKRVREGYLLTHYIGAFEQIYTELLERSPQSNGWIAASTWPRAYSRWLTRAAGRRLRRLTEGARNTSNRRDRIRKSPDGGVQPQHLAVQSR